MASAFGLTVGTLRQKSLADARFIRSNKFKRWWRGLTLSFLIRTNIIQPSSSIECPSQKPASEILLPSKKNLVQGNENSESPPLLRRAFQARQISKARARQFGMFRQNLTRSFRGHSPNSGPMRICLLPPKKRKFREIADGRLDGSGIFEA